MMLTLLVSSLSWIIVLYCPRSSALKIVISCVRSIFKLFSAGSKCGLSYFILVYAEVPNSHLKEAIQEFPSFALSYLYGTSNLKHTLY